MEKILYDLMDWAGIEELVYSEASDPGRLLGEHVIKEGLLIQAFLPNAEKVSVKIGEEQFPMEMADENAGSVSFLYHLHGRGQRGDHRPLQLPVPHRLYRGRGAEVQCGDLL